MSGYTRQSSSDLVPTAVIRSSPLNTEYNKIRDAFAFDATGVTGHKHDGSSDEGSYIPLIADLDALNKVEVDTGNNRVGFFVEVSSAAVEQVRLSDGLFVPVTTNDVDLGSATAKFKDLHLAGNANVAGDVNVTGALVGAVTGDITGNVTGDLTGNVTAGSGESSFTNVTINGTLDVTNTPITNVSDPTSAQEAATKNYVDTADALKLNLTGGTLSGELAMGTSKITGLGDPTLAQDAATKAYVDSEVSGLIDAAPGALDTLNELAAAIGDDAAFSTTITNSIATKLPLAGGTMSGTIAMGTSKITGLGDPTLAQDAATKTYVDTADALKLNLTGGTMSGAIAMGNSQITGLATPTTGTDATTKTYVDGILTSGEDATAAAAAALASELEAEAAEAAAEAARDLALAYRDSAAVSAALAAAEAAGIVGYDLSAISDTLVVTAVDVFVYDTTQDSDGDAWRNRCQHTSWYNETLNTATRGARQEFPVKALIVAEGAKVTIYDLDDPAVPMWKVFDFTGFTVRKAIARNGKIFVATTTGLVVLDLITDEIDVAVTYSASTTPAIVNNTVNDVAITVLDGAPIDPQTGLPVSTIAVATEGGVSVIKDDGTVVDITDTGANDYCDALVIDGGRLVFAMGGPINNNAVRVFEPIPTGAITHTLNTPTSTTGQNPTMMLNRGISSGDANFLDEVTNISGAVRLSGDAIGTPKGLTRFKPNPTTPANGMVAYTTADYATGWQHGDIKGAFLCEASEDDLVGVELVTNGTFDTDTTGWTPENVNSVLTIDSAQLKVATTGVEAGYAYQSFSTVIGKTYVVSGDGDETTGSGAAAIYAGNSAGNSSLGFYNIAGAETGVSFSFTATATTTFITLANTLVGPSYTLFDNISVKLANEDRSVNNNDLAVNGTITVAPVTTGSDTMGYTFSGSEAVTLGADISASGSLLWWEKVSGIWQLNMNDLSGGIDYVNGTSGTVSTGATISGTTLTFAASKEMSRVRPSATIPTPEQIRKIYNDERPLYFVTGSQSTINGTSSAVTAMSSDPVTGLLQVGTSGGLSAFRGLQRVEQDTTAVTTTISANGATVARQ